MRIMHRLAGRLVQALLVAVLAGVGPKAFAIAFSPNYLFIELFPESMRTAFDYAANDILGDMLLPSYQGETVDVTIRWRELGWPGPYAEARPPQMLRNFDSESTSYRKDTYYPSALANHLAGKDFGVPDVVLTLNISSIIDGKVTWYLGTDGKAKPNQVDYVTLVLHELVHGIGFYSAVNGDGSFSRVDPAGPTIYDRYLTGIVFDDAGKPASAVRLTEMDTDADRAKAIRWPELMWNGQYGKEAATGGILFLHSPKDYIQGISVSHVDARDASLMNPSYAGPNHELDRITLGMLKDMGWTVSETPEPSALLLAGLAVVLALVRQRPGLGQRRKRW